MLIKLQVQVRRIQVILANRIAQNACSAMIICIYQCMETPQTFLNIRKNQINTQCIVGRQTCKFDSMCKVYWNLNIQVYTR